MASLLLTKLLRPTKTPTSSALFYLTRSAAASHRNFASVGSDCDASACVIIETDMDPDDYNTLATVNETGVTTEWSGFLSDMKTAVQAGRPYSRKFTIRRFGVVKVDKTVTFETDPATDTLKILENKF